MKGPKIPTKITVVCKLWGAKVHVYQVCFFRNRTELPVLKNGDRLIHWMQLVATGSGSEK